MRCGELARLEIRTKVRGGVEVEAGRRTVILDDISTCLHGAICRRACAEYGDVVCVYVVYVR